MGGKRKQEKPSSAPQTAHVRQQPITETLELNYMPYAMSVIVSRAIPEIDGFKPAHRKLLYTMYKMNLLSGARTKSANIVGQTMKLNPHGDQAIYETMVRLTRGNASLLHPYIDSKGNFGKQYSSDMQYAAPRYTEAKLDKFCETLFTGIDKEVVDFADNYDGTLREPMLLPAAFPSILVNANQGIAVGMASNICSFNLTEVCRAMIAYIHDPATDILELMPGPDFAGGGDLIYDRESMESLYRQGRGSFKLRARYRIDKKNNLIEIFEIPYSASIEQIIDDIAGLVKQNKIKDISDVRDETDLNGLKLTIDYRRSADPEQLMQKLFLQTRLEDSFSCNFNVLINGTPRVLGVKQLLAEWLSFRRLCVRRGLAFDLQQKQERLHLLRGLEKILLDIDKAIAIIRQTEKESEVVANLCAGFAIDEIQAEFVAEIKLRHLNRQYILQRTADIKKLNAEIKDIQKTLEDEARVDALIVKELERIIGQYGQPRRTQLIAAHKIETISADDMIEDYRLRLFLTRHGYIKKLALTSLRSAGDLRTKEEDEIVQEIEAGNKQEVIFFSNRCQAYKLYIYEITDQKPSDLGAYGQNLLNMDADETVVFMYLPGDYSGQLVAAFENGKAVRFTVDSFQTKNRRRKLVKAYSDKSPLVALHEFDQNGREGEEKGNAASGPEPDEQSDSAKTELCGDFLLRSDFDKQVLFNAGLLPLMGSRSSQGVQVMTLKRGEKIVGFCRASNADTNDTGRYRIHKLPGRGFYIKGKTIAERQQRLDI